MNTVEHRARSVSQKWRDCIVSYIDVIGTRRKDHPSKLMRALHALIADTRRQLADTHRVYAWNDSVLLLSFADGPSAYSRAMHDADTLKKRIDIRIAPSYGIAVKGQAFPQLGLPAGAADQGLIVIEASSWAMANCFEIERQVKDWRRQWYVDIRIAREIVTSRSFEERKFSMLGARGERRERAVRGFNGCLWA